MKKLIAWILMLVCMMSLIGCYAQEETKKESAPISSGEKNESETASASEEDTSSKTPETDFVIYENGTWYVILPISGKKLNVSREYAEYVDYDMLKAAEEKVTEQVLVYQDYVAFFLYTRNKQLFLGAEAIIMIDPPPEMTPEEEEYWMDHEHREFSEPITPKIPVE